jgi:hypothetical protein
MRPILGTVAIAAVIAVSARNVDAQSESDVAAFFAMSFTPYAALTPTVTPLMAGRARPDGQMGSFVEARYGHWQFDEAEEGWNSYALGGRFGAFGVILGYGKCEDCDDGIIMAGVDYEAILTRSPLGTDGSSGSFAVGVRPSLGYGKPTGDEDEGDAIAVNVDVPLSLSVPVGTGAQFVPFIAPGLGWGRLSADEENESGTRGAIGAGVGFLTAGGFGAHLSMRKIFIEDGPTTYGVGISFGR